MKYNNKMNPDYYVFICYFEDKIIAQMLRDEKRLGFTDIVGVFKNMFRGYSPVIVVRMSAIECHLCTQNFNGFNIKVEEFTNYYNKQKENSPLNYMRTVSATDKCSIYYEFTNGTIIPTLNKTSNYLGYMFDENYFILVTYLFRFNANNHVTRRIETNNFGSLGGLPTTTEFPSL